MSENESNKKANDNEYRTLDEAHINTIKELTRIVREQAKQLEHINISKYDTCCKYITISVIAIALFATIALCCIFGQRNLKIESVPNTKPRVCNVSCSSTMEEK